MDQMDKKRIMRQIISSFAVEYQLSVSEVRTEIEHVFSQILAKWYGCEVMVFFRDDLELEAIAYDRLDGVIRQQMLDFTGTRGFNTLQKHLQERLGKAALLKKTGKYKVFEKELRWGEIAGCDADNNLYVEIEVLAGEKITAVCPQNRIGLHEHNSTGFSIGMKRAFHVRRVDPVLLNGTCRLKVVVDRVSKTLVEALLKDCLGTSADNSVIRCTHRYVGHKSFVLSSTRLPKSAVISVARELGENIQVRFPGSR